LVSKLLSETIKQEEFDNISIQEAYSIANRSKTNITQLPPPTGYLFYYNKSNKNFHIFIFSVVTTVHLNPREILNGLSDIPMTNTSSHLMSTLNPSHLTDGTGSYFVSGIKNIFIDIHNIILIKGLSDLASNFKLNPSSNTDLPSPSSSSNSSNPPSSSHHHHQHQHHQTRRHGEGGDPTRKRQMRLQKNR
jgi:hypothetical protein